MDNCGFTSSSDNKMDQRQTIEVDSNKAPRLSINSSRRSKDADDQNCLHGSSPTFRPRRILTSISHALTPRFLIPDYLIPEDGPELKRRRRNAVWHPMCALVSRMRPQTPTSIDTDQTVLKSSTTVNHCGRFKIGHPLSCNALIDDDPIENVRTGFINEIGNKPFLTIQKTTNKIYEDNCVSVQSNRRCVSSSQKNAAIYMDEDLLRCSCIEPDNDRVIVRVNVSGVKFLVLLSTLQRDPFVFSKFIEDALWIPDRREYFFERDPVVFRFVHNYLRRGEVHLPSGMCGPLMEKELDDWGIPLGLDVQRCCLGPMMDTKFKLESLQKFERKLEPKYIKPNSWIRSPAWQSFRSKVWQVIDFAPKLSAENAQKGRSTDLINSDEIYSEDKTIERKEHDKFSSTGSAQLPIGKTDVVENGVAPPNEQLSISGEPRGNEPQANVRMATPTPEQEVCIRWFKRMYVIYETLTVTAAVIVFMLSSCQAFRVPLSTTGSGKLVTNLTNVHTSHGLLNTNNAVGEVNKNVTVFTLPNNALVSMDIFFSIIITFDVLIRMIFCPALRPWLCSLATLIDILSLIPFYCELILFEMIYYNAITETNGLLKVLMRMEEYIVVLKVFIVLRLFRILRRHRGTRVLLYTIRTTFFDLAIIIVLIMESALFFGAAIYFTDDTFHDIPTGFWWALITMSTVGYGDLVPSNTFGYMVATVCVITGTLLMSYTIPILVNHFLLYYDHADQLYMMKQLHRSAKRKASRRTMSRYAQKALASAKVLVSATWTKSVAKTSTSSKPMDVKDTDSKNDERAKT